MSKSLIDIRELPLTFKFKYAGDIHTIILTHHSFRWQRIYDSLNVEDIEFYPKIHRLITIYSELLTLDEPLIVDHASRNNIEDLKHRLLNEAQELRKNVNNDVLSKLDKAVEDVSIMQ